MDIFQRFVAENVDQSSKLMREKTILISEEMMREFEHYCRKRNLSFNQAIVELIQGALDKEKKLDVAQEKQTEPNASMFMKDAW